MSLRIDVIRLTGDAGFGATLTHEHLDALTRLVDMAQAAEREACAKVCEDYGTSNTTKACAQAIRARGASPQRCTACGYQHGHAIGCVNNPVDIAINARSAA